MTTINATLDRLTASPSIIDATATIDGQPQRLVCGAVGGFRAGPDLLFGLQQATQSAYAGTAWLHDNGDGTTTVSLFLASNLTGRTPAATAAATPGAPAPLQGGAPAAPNLPPPIYVTGIVVENGAFTANRIV